MISKKDIRKMVSHVVKSKQGIPDRRLMHPDREWSIGLLLWLLVVTSGGIYSMIVFNSYAGITVDNVRVEINQLRYHKADVREAIELYQKRKNTYDALLQNQFTPISDPNQTSTVLDQKPEESTNEVKNESESTISDLDIPTLE